MTVAHGAANAPWLRLMPFLFVILWNPAFVATRAGLANVSTFAFPTARFTLAAPVLVAIAMLMWTGLAALSTARIHLAVAPRKDVKL